MMIKVSNQVLAEGVADASELGIAPGQWPKHIMMEDGFGYLEFSGLDHNGSGIYTCLSASLTVYND